MPVSSPLIVMFWSSGCEKIGDRFLCSILRDCLGLSGFVLRTFGLYLRPYSDSHPWIPGGVASASSSTFTRLYVTSLNRQTAEKSVSSLAFVSHDLHRCSGSRNGIYNIKKLKLKRSFLCFVFGVFLVRHNRLIMQSFIIFPD